MKTTLIKPDFYDRFQCIAGDCSFTCCQSWEIAVDPATETQWKSRRETACFTEKLTDSADRHIRLREDHFCPFLREDGLCRIVAAYGEEAISLTCHTFPREKHVFADRIEYSLSMSCPAALDLMWDSAEITHHDSSEAIYDRVHNELTSGACLQVSNHRKSDVGCVMTPANGDRTDVSNHKNSDAGCLMPPANGDLTDVSNRKNSDVWQCSPVHCLRPFATVSESSSEKGDRSAPADGLLLRIRREFIRIMEDPKLSVREAFLMLFYLILDFYDHRTHLNRKICDRNFSDKFMDELLAAVREAGQNTDFPDTFAEQNELFLDLAESYRRKHLYEDRLEPLAQLAEAFEAAFSASHRSDDGPTADQNPRRISELLTRFASVRTSWEPELRLLMEEELYTSLYLPGDNIDSMVRNLEWIGMTLAILNHCLFLTWYRQIHSTPDTIGISGTAAFRVLTMFLVTPAFPVTTTYMVTTAFLIPTAFLILTASLILTAFLIPAAFRVATAFLIPTKVLIPTEVLIPTTVRVTTAFLLQKYLCPAINCEK